MARKIYMTVGLPGSGKSTWVKNHLKDHPDTLVVSRDDLREHLHAGTYIYDELLEPVISSLSNHILEDLIYRTNKDIIIDETNGRLDKRLKIINSINYMKGVSPFARNIEIIAVVFPEPENILDRRMQNDRGYTREEWQAVIDGMKSYWKPVELEEGFTAIVTVK